MGPLRAPSAGEQPRCARPQAWAALGACAARVPAASPAAAAPASCAASLPALPPCSAAIAQLLLDTDQELLSSAEVCFLPVVCLHYLQLRISKVII